MPSARPPTRACHWCCITHPALYPLTNHEAKAELVLLCEPRVGKVEGVGESGPHVTGVGQRQGLASAELRCISALCVGEVDRDLFVVMEPLFSIMVILYRCFTL